jgi:hypothetical protein
VDGILKAQAASDTAYFVAKCRRAAAVEEAGGIETAFLAAYRWQYIHLGASHRYFRKVLSGLITDSQSRRIEASLSHAALSQSHVFTNMSTAEGDRSWTATL